MTTLTLKDYTDEAFPLFVTHSRAHAEYPIHDHEFSELVVIFSGSGVHVFNDEDYDVRTGDAFVVNPPASHGYRSAESMELINVLYDPARLSLPDDDLRDIPGYHSLFLLEPRLRRRHEFKSRLRVAYESLAPIRELALGIRGELERKRPGYRSLTTARFLELIVLICRNLVEKTDKRYRTVYDFGKVLSHMERHFSEPLTLADLAKIANMSTRSFQRKFKEALGAPPVDYLLNVRIREAENLLRQSSKTVTEIAYETGFADGNYFARQFRKRIGLAPGVFRKRPVVLDGARNGVRRANRGT